MIEKAIRSLLVNRAGLASGSRVYPEGMVPENGPKPYVEYAKAAMQSDLAHDGPIGQRVVILQVNVISTGLDALTVGDAEAERIRGVLHGYSGSVQLASQAIAIDSIEALDRRDVWEEALTEGAEITKSIQQDFRIVYQ